MVSEVPVFSVFSDVFCIPWFLRFRFFRFFQFLRGFLPPMVSELLVFSVFSVSSVFFASECRNVGILGVLDHSFLLFAMNWLQSKITITMKIL